MTEQYILSVDQSTQGTKALLFDTTGKLLCRTDRLHKQMISEQGWISHDLNEIYENTIQVVRDIVTKAQIEKSAIKCLGISNQRETSCAWNKQTGEPIAPAVVWQCSRAKDICMEIEEKGMAETIRKKTGIQLSPFFPASKFAWFMRNTACAEEMYRNHKLMFGTVDTWLIYKLTGKQAYKTDYSNASRTQLFNLRTLQWDDEICRLFGYRAQDLAQVCDSNATFGMTDFEGYLDRPIPICGVLGDSHGALFGQGCLKKGMIKTTYGTGSSIMMNIGTEPIFSEHGVVTSIAWGMNGKVNYVLEGNINYTGAVITWLHKDVGLIASPGEAEKLATQANEEDTAYLVPAFSGLGAPYWNNDALAVLSGMSRVTGRREIVKAGVESIAYQIADVVTIMKQDSGIEIEELRVDGGPTRNQYLMQFQSDLINIPVQVPEAEELSGIGAAYMAGLSSKLLTEDVFDKINRKQYTANMTDTVRQKKIAGWIQAVKLSLRSSGKSLTSIS